MVAMNNIGGSSLMDGDGLFRENRVVITPGLKL